jgi:hypothetical protein
MKQRFLLALLTVCGLAAAGSLRAEAQARPTTRSRSSFHVAFQRAWDLPVPDPVKLIEIGAVTDPKRNNLVMMTGGKDANDYKRRLLVMHWGGVQFVPDYTTEFLGTSLDALIVGHFRVPRQPVGLKPIKGKEPPMLPANQVVTTEGVYTWTGNGLSRLFAAPPGVRLSLVLEKSLDQIVTGNGGGATAFQVEESGVRPLLSFDLPSDSPGYVHYGIGLQDFSGVEKMGIGAGVRYAQSFWTGRSKWFIGVARGKASPTQDLPTYTMGDQLVVFTPKFANKNKTFWESKQDDFEEAWRSDPLPGQILDVRVGDPKNEGKDGLLVLTLENGGKDRHLYFYTVAPGSFSG